MDLESGLTYSPFREFFRGRIEAKKLVEIVSSFPSIPQDARKLIDYVRKGDISLLEAEYAVFIGEHKEFEEEAKWAKRQVEKGNYREVGFQFDLAVNNGYILSLDEYVARDLGERVRSRKNWERVRRGNISLENIQELDLDVDQGYLSEEEYHHAYNVGHRIFRKFEITQVLDSITSGAYSFDDIVFLDEMVSQGDVGMGDAFEALFEGERKFAEAELYDANRGEFGEHALENLEWFAKQGYISELDVRNALYRWDQS